MKRKSGRCGCDEDLSTVRAVRALGVCWWCGDIGIDLMRFGWERLHVRCAWKKLDYRTFAILEMRQRRTRLCCLGPTRMRRLLHSTTDDGGRTAPAQDWT